VTETDPEADTEATTDPRPWALADRLVQAQVEARLLGKRAEPTALGRYRIERGLGQGSMGRLLLGFDPDLQRPVALKLVSPSRIDSSEARRRIVREARAMAQLSDPHVAQVYEVGEAEGQLYVAMEFVDGQDLRAWQGERARPWPEVLAVFRQAGAGLAAAHDKGIVHRDFKPDNVMLEHGGRARVIDFGLAFPLQAGDAAARVSTGEGPVELTKTGTVMGTPAYLAPEQWGGTAADARGDQFSFCVASFEALVGRRPFEGTTLEALRRATLRGQVEWGSTTVPRWVRRAVARGLRVDPAARWPDMRALVRALDPARRRRRLGVAGIGLALVATTGLALLRPSIDACHEADVALQQDWGPAQREAIAGIGASVEADWAEASATGLLARLDAHAEAWRDAARGICAAARARGTSEEAAGAGCLHEARRRLSELVDDARSADPGVLVSVLARAELLPDPRACPEAPAAVFAAGSPAGEDVRRLLVEIERGLGASSVRAGARSFTEASAGARAAADAAIEAATELGYEPLLGRALWLAGRVRLVDGEPTAAERELRRALVVAQRASDAPLAAAIVTELVYAVSRDLDRFREAEDLAEEVAAMIAALGEPPLLSARLQSHRASAIAHARQADRDEAVRLHEEALARLTEVLGPRHPATIVELGNLGAALNYAERSADAEARLVEAIAAGRAAWGDEHPRLALLLGTLGLSRMRQGDLAGAEQHLRRSLEIRETTLGSDHPQVDDARYNLASLLRRAERHREALPLLELGLAHARQRKDPEGAGLGPWWVATGESSLAVGDRSRAREALTEALRSFERTGASATDYARVRLALARAWSTEEPALARTIARQALADATEAGANRRREEIEGFLAAL